jgi:3-oxoacyl-[acyl-carrier protein] reductase
MPNVFDLNGKTCLITGAGSSKGIGFASAKLLQKMGATVFLAGKSERVKDRAQELGCLYFCADLTKETEVKELFIKVSQEFKILDVLVNNAGMTAVNEQAGQESGDISQTSYEMFTASWQRNLGSIFLVTKAFLPLLRKSDNPRVVMISSITGTLMAMKNEVSYAASKAGISGLTKALALDFASDKILVNAIAPGWVATDSQLDSEVQAGLNTPLQRSARPEEIASLVGYLASDEASYLTGQIIAVDGGNSIQEER